MNKTNQEKNMAEENVVKFPEHKTKRARKIQRIEAHRAILGLSLASIVLSAVFLNDQIIKYGQSSHTVAMNYQHDSNRMLASTPNNTLSLPQGLKFEEEIAKKLNNNENREPASLGKKPSPFDELSFGFFERKYGFRYEDGKLSEVEFIESTGDRPKYVNDRLGFLSEYKEALGYSFAEIKKVSAGPKGEEYELVDSNNQVVSRVSFEMDSYGRLMKIKFR